MVQPYPYLLSTQDRQDYKQNSRYHKNSTDKTHQSAYENFKGVGRYIHYAHVILQVLIDPFRYRSRFTPFSSGIFAYSTFPFRWT